MRTTTTDGRTGRLVTERFMFSSLLPLCVCVFVFFFCSNRWVDYFFACFDFTTHKNARSKDNAKWGSGWGGVVV